MFASYAIPLSLLLFGGITAFAFKDKLKSKHIYQHAIFLCLLSIVSLFIWNSAINVCINEFKASHAGEEMFLYEAYYPYILSYYWLLVPSLTILWIIYLPVLIKGLYKKTEQ